MVKRSALVVVGMVLLGAGNAGAQNVSAGNALFDLLYGANGEAALNLSTTAALAMVLPSEAASFPLASSSGGFSWTLDPALGLQTRRSSSFGPMFAERPLTNGIRKLNLGIAFQHASFDSLAGQKMSDLHSVFTIGRLVETFSSSVKFTTDQTIISASYGVHDRVDVGVIVPFVRMSASGSTAFRAAIDGTPVTEDVCIDPFCPISRNNIKGTSSGIGDVIVRSKVALKSSREFGLAAGVDLRLPTGNEDELLGLGEVQTKLTLLGAYSRGSVSPHFNVGYTFSGKGIPFAPDGSVKIVGTNGDWNLAPSSEVNYTFGADWSASDSVTVLGDFIGRQLRNSARFEQVNDPSSSYITVKPGTLNLLLGTVGTKVRVGGNWLATASLVFPLNSAGVKPGVTPVVGMERAF